MRRECLTCGRPLAAADLARDRSRQMEADRKAAGLEGVRFLYYRCGCGADDVFDTVGTATTRTPSSRRRATSRSASP